MNRGVWTLASLTALLITGLGASAAQAATKISTFGFVITAPGTYQVTQDLNGSGNAITVLTGNVDLHLGGHTLSGDGSRSGIDVEGPAAVSGCYQQHRQGEHGPEQQWRRSRRRQSQL